jgi:hypothetical protein
MDTQRFIDYWNNSKLAGNLLSSNVINNPQYKLTLKTQSHLQIRLETFIATPIMIIVIEGGNHLTKVNYDAYLNNKNAGFYFNSFSYFECVLEKGEYTIVCVSQEEKMIGKYCLEVSISKKCEFLIEKMLFPQYVYTEILRAEWMQKNSISSHYIKNNIHLFMNNPGFIFNTSIKTKVMFALKISKNKFHTNESYNLGIYLLLIKDEEITVIYHFTATALANIGIYSE